MKKRSKKIANKVIRKVARWVEGGWAWSYPLLYGAWGQALASPVVSAINAYSPENASLARNLSLFAGGGGTGLGIYKALHAMAPREVPTTYRGNYQPIEVLPTHGWRGFLSAGLARTLTYLPPAILTAYEKSMPGALLVPPVLGAIYSIVPGVLHYLTGPWLRKMDDHFNYWESGAKSDKRYIEMVLDTLRFSDNYDEFAQEMAKLRNIYLKNIANWETLFRTFDDKYPKMVTKALPHFIQVVRGVNGVIEPLGMFAHNAGRLHELAPDLDPTAYLVSSTLGGIVIGATVPSPELERVILDAAGYALRSEKAPKSLEEIKQRYKAIRNNVTTDANLPFVDKRMERMFEAAEQIRRVDLYKPQRMRDRVELLFQQVRPVFHKLMEESYRDFMEGVANLRRIAVEAGEQK